MNFTDQDDHALRTFANRLHSELGEDAYHEVFCDVLVRGQMEQIRNYQAFFRVAMKRTLYKFFRHARAELDQTAAWMTGDPIPQHAGLVMGRQRHTHCRRGHPLTEENLAYIGPRRTCRTCKRAREALAARTARAHQKQEAAYA